MDCPYCSDRLTRHIQHQQIYWFCRSCWQRISDVEMDQVDLSLGFCCGSATVKLSKTTPYRVCRQLKERLATVSEVAARTA